MYRTLAESFTETMVFAPINCDPGGMASSLLEEAYALGLGRRSPDTYDDVGQRRFRGELDAARDYRGLIPHLTVVSAPDLGGRNDITPLSNVQNAHINKSSITHASWVMTSNHSGAGRADIVKHIGASSNGTNTTCPSQNKKLFGGCR
jgi:hypothetical protein